MSNPNRTVNLSLLLILALETPFSLANRLESIDKYQYLKANFQTTTSQQKSFPLKATKKLQNKQSGNSNKGSQLIDLFNPPGDGLPEDTEVGGTRSGDSCLPDEPTIHTLMPEANYGLTLQESPQIYLYIPQTSAKEVLVTLQDETGNFYETGFLPIEINPNSQIASFTLPKAVIPLESGKRYQWFVTVICDRFVKPNDPTFSGWIKRTEKTSEITQQLASKSAEEKAKWYSQNSYWYDMLDSIPTNSNLWQEIVKQITS